MPRNSSGSYTLPAGNPVTSGTTISTTWANTTLNDLGTELSDSASRSGKGGFTAPVRVPDGTAAAPAVAFVAETNSGFYRAGATDVRLAMGGVDVLTTSGIAFPSTAGFGPVVSATGANKSVGLQGNRAAADTAAADVVIGSTAARTAGLLLDVQNPVNGASKLNVDYQGLLRLATPAAAIQPASVVTAITPAGGWGSGRAAGYWKDANGVVRVRGSAIWHTAAGALTVLPAGFKPADQRAFVAYNRMRPGFVVLSISLGGAITLDAGAVVDGDEIYLDPISFLAEQ